jgi:hypothetical protein
MGKTLGVPNSTDTMKLALYILAGTAFLLGRYLIAALLFIGGAFLSVYEKLETGKLQSAHKQNEEQHQLQQEHHQLQQEHHQLQQEHHQLQQEHHQLQQEQREFDAFYQEWGLPHHDDEVRLKVYAEKHGLSYREAAEQAFEHYCFTVHNPWEEVRKDAKELIKRLPEAVSIAQKQGFTVELGNTSYYRSPSDRSRIKWGEAHLPVCKVSKDGQVRHYFPADFVKFALDDCIASKDERESNYPYNQPGQAQLERLFVEGSPKNKTDEFLEKVDEDIKTIISKGSDTSTRGGE